MTTKRRDFGRIRKLPSGRYQAVIQHDGKKIALGTFDKRAQAAQKLATTQTDLARGQWIDPAAGRALFAEYADAWLKRRTDDPRNPLAPTTLSKYRRLLNAYLLPEFDNAQLASIKPDQVREWHDRIAREHPSTAADAYRLTSTIFNAAVSDEIIGRTPCRRLERGSRHQAARRDIATMGQLQEALDAAPEQYRLAFLLAAWCGLRRSEIIGLQRDDVDLLDGSFKVQRAVCLTSDDDKVQGPPKSVKGRRTVQMPPQVAEAMATHLEHYSGTVWLYERNGQPLHPRTLLRAWVRAREAAGRPDLHLHDLRHHYGTKLAQAGATIAETMDAMGQASPAAAMMYQEAERNRQKVHAAALGRMAAATPVDELHEPVENRH